ncbi:Hypothetical predicted protein [Marmota monax]|uniref:Uncharacterized protein n=1 Tax=Marmota monax TaxID=9995 RepID=A0A5E4A4H5_MARMO|nr:Hypothetical predicted protein [Marmota monax]
MKYLSEWDQWKQYSSKSWKRFLEKAREMTTHLELWRKDIRSIEGTWTWLRTVGPAAGASRQGAFPPATDVSSQPRLGLAGPVAPGEAQGPCSGVAWVSAVLMEMLRMFLLFQPRCVAWCHRTAYRITGSQPARWKPGDLGPAEALKSELVTAPGLFARLVVEQAPPWPQAPPHAGWHDSGLSQPCCSESGRPRRPQGILASALTPVPWAPVVGPLHSLVQQPRVP